MKDIFNPLKSNRNLIGVVAILALQICLIIPLGVFIGNSEEFSYGFIEVFISALKNSALVGIILFLPALLIRNWGSIIYNKILLSCIIVVFLNSQFLITDYGTFDGRGLKIQKFGVNSIVQIFIFFAICIFVIGLKKLKLTNLVVGLIVGLSFFVNAIIFTLNGNTMSKHPSIAGDEFVTLSKTQPNIIHILLDEISGSSSKEILSKEHVLANSFSGFLYYDNTAAIFPTTIMSVPAMVSGTPYQDGAFVDDFFRESFQNSQMLNLLEEKNYDIKLHTLNFYCKYFSEGECSTAGHLGVGYKNAKRDYIQTLNMGTFLAVPDIIKSAIYRDGNWFFGSGLKGDNLSADNQYMLDEFDFILDRLSTGGNKPTYRFFHSLLTHSPIKFNKRCKAYSKNPERSYESYLPQDECGLRLASKVVKKIQELGVYDNTMIIISSDHGRPFVRKELQQAFNLTYALNNQTIANSWHYGYSHATLMVKPFNSTKRFEMTDDPASLLDIPYFIMASANDQIHIPEFERVYTYYRWSKNYWKWEAAKLPPFDRIFSIKGHISDPKNWTRLKNYRQALDTQRDLPIQKDLPRKAISCGYARTFTSDLPEIDIEGLSFQESWGRWSDGDSVKFQFIMPKDKCEKSQISLSMLSYVNENIPSQSADVYLNNILVDNFTLKYKVNKSATIVIDLPSELLRLGQKNTLRLKLKNAAVPPQYVGQSNARKLAFGFTSIQIH